MANGGGLWPGSKKIDSHGDGEIGRGASLLAERGCGKTEDRSG